MLTTCLKPCLSMFKIGGSTNDDNPTLVRFSNIKGPSVRASNFSLEGDGTCLVNTPLLQTRSYFELEVVDLGEKKMLSPSVNRGDGGMTEGSFSVGVTYKAQGDLNRQLLNRNNSWGVSSQQIKIKVGDILGISYDMSQVKSELSFYKNGHKLKKHTVIGIRGDVFPAISVCGGCMIEANFGQSGFQNCPPLFDGIIFSRDII